MNEDIFMKRLKERLLIEFKKQDRSGVYGYTQRSMAYNSNRIEGSTLTEKQTASMFETGTLYTDDTGLVKPKIATLDTVLCFNSIPHIEQATADMHARQNNISIADTDTCVILPPITSPNIIITIPPNMN